MSRKLIFACLVAFVASVAAPSVVPSGLFAQEKQVKKAAPKLKVGKNEKVCNYRFPDGERRSWVCDKVVPCCAWDAIKYVKCGNTFTGCL